jgi:hypothetical protein
MKTSMVDLGHKYDDSEMCVPEKSNKEHISYPSLYLDTEELPELQGCKVGEEVELHFVAKIRGMNISDHGEGKSAHYDFDLLKGSVETGNEPDEADEMMEKKPKRMPFDEDETPEISDEEDTDD